MGGLSSAEFYPMKARLLAYHAKFARPEYYPHKGADERWAFLQSKFPKLITRGVGGAENVTSSKTAKGAAKAWRKSSGHFKAIMAPKITKCGIGVYQHDGM